MLSPAQSKSFRQSKKIYIFVYTYTKNIYVYAYMQNNFEYSTITYPVKFVQISLIVILL